jgi:hypothetical protein
MGGKRSRGGARSLINEASAFDPFPLPYPGPMQRHEECLRIIAGYRVVRDNPAHGIPSVDGSVTRSVLRVPFVNKGEPVILDRRRTSSAFSANPSVDGNAARSARPALWSTKGDCH